MPNWCSNYITITGDSDVIAILTRALENIPEHERDNDNVFETLIGREPEIGDEQYQSGGWYDSNIGWFGTKWDVSYKSCEFQFGENFIVMSPLTAWSPPIGFGVRLHEQYGVKVEIQYEEPGTDFCGKATMENQQLIDEEHTYMKGKYILDNESFWYEVESNISVSSNDNIPIEEFLLDYDFVDEEDRNEIQKMYEESLSGL
jgi:hypothetical protein